MTLFSVSEALRHGHIKTKEQFFPILRVLLPLFFLQIVVAIAVEDHDVLEVVAQVFLMPGFSLAVLSVLFRVMDGQLPEYRHLLERFSYYSHFVFTNLLYTLAIILGLFCLIIPGVYVAVRLMYVFPIVVEKNVHPLEAFRMSWSLTRGLFWKLLGLNVVLGFVNFCGMLLLGVGLLYSIPMTGMAFLFTYTILSRIRTGGEQSLSDHSETQSPLPPSHIAGTES